MAKCPEEGDPELCHPSPVPVVAPELSRCSCPELISTRKRCGKAPRFNSDEGRGRQYIIPDSCPPPEIREPVKEPLNPVGAFGRKPELRVENDETRRRQLCTSIQPPDVVFDWPRTDCRKSDAEPKHMAPRFRPSPPAADAAAAAAAAAAADAACDDLQASNDPRLTLRSPLECCRPPIRKARIRQTLCQRDTKVKWTAPFIPILNTPGLDPREPRDLGPPSLGHRYTSVACKKGFFCHVPIPEANPCHVSEEEKEDLYKRMVYTTTARRMMNDIPHRENVRLPLTTTLEKRADMVKYRPKVFAPVTALWQQVPTIWDRPQLKTKVDNVVGDRDTALKINNIFPSREMLKNNRMIMPPCPVAPRCYVCQEQKPTPKYSCITVCPHERPEHS